MILGERDVFLGVHLTPETKEKFRQEAKRRKTTMSALASEIIEQFLEFAPSEQLEPVRSNKRGIVDPLQDVPLPLEG